MYPEHNDLGRIRNPMFIESTMVINRK